MCFRGRARWTNSTEIKHAASNPSGPRFKAGNLGGLQGTGVKNVKKFTEYVSEEKRADKTKETFEKEEESSLNAVIALVDNIENLYVKAQCMKLTRFGFIDVLRQVQQEKYFAVKDAKEEFKKRIQMVVRAKNYELKWERIIAIEAAKKLVNKRCLETQSYFNTEVESVKAQFKQLTELVEFFEKIIHQQAGVVTLQEKVISRLSNSLFTQKVDEELVED